jgi:coenzyme Q-binding protein COQ10
VPAYSYFLPFCTGSTVLDAAGQPATNWRPGTQPFVVNAELAVGFGGLEERYISRVVGVPFESVSVSLPPSKTKIFLC